VFAKHLKEYANHLFLELVSDDDELKQSERKAREVRLPADIVQVIVVSRFQSWDRCHCVCSRC
jgi:hypothetical protein